MPFTLYQISHGLLNDILYRKYIVPYAAENFKIKSHSGLPVRHNLLIFSDRPEIGRSQAEILTKNSIKVCNVRKTDFLRNIDHGHIRVQQHQGRLVHAFPVLYFCERTAGSL